MTAKTTYSDSQIIKRIVNSGVDQENLFEVAAGICRGVNLISLSIIIMNFIFGPIFAGVLGNLSIFIGSLIEMILLILVIFFNAWKRHNCANILFFLTINAATIFFGMLLDKHIHSVTMMTVFLAGISMFMFSDKRLIWICTFVSLSSLLLVLYCQDYPIIQPVIMSDKVAKIMQYVALGVVTTIVMILFRLFANLKQQAYELKDKMLEKKDQFIRNVGHQWKLNFAPIHTMVNVLGEQLNIDKVSDDILDLENDEAPNASLVCKELFNSCVDFAVFTHNLMDYPRFRKEVYQTPIYAAVNLYSLIGTICKRHHMIASEKGLKIMMVFPPDIEYIITDSMKVERILYNLLSNAIKWAFVNSKIFVVVRENVKQWSIEVRNEGETIPKEKRDTIFRIYTTERNDINPKGVGIGLYVTNKLVNELQGRMMVESEEGQTSFIAIFPIRKTTSAVNIA